MKAEELRNTLFDYITRLDEGQGVEQKAFAVASLARESLKSVKLQIDVARYSNKALPKSVTDFAE